MIPTDLVDRLAQHQLLRSAPHNELDWLAAHGTLWELEAGAVLIAKGTRSEHLFVLLSGHISMSIDRGAGPSKLMGWRAGDVMGMLPYSRLLSPPGDAMAQERSIVFAVHRDQFREMTRECYEITSILVHSMLDRARVFTLSALHDEKMISLGKLSAGLAHELNNPASAIERGAVLIATRLEELEEASNALRAAGLGQAQWKALDTLRAACLGADNDGPRSPIEEAEREEAVIDWLSDHHLDPRLADTLAETSVTVDALAQASAALDASTLPAAVRSAAAACSAHRIASELQDAAMRISGLVTAVKGFTHMDQAALAEPVDLTRGLKNTIAVVKSKAQAKSASIILDVQPEFPKVLGFAGELNQIWANLIDNALDAIPQSGCVQVSARQERDHAVVRIADNGTGIPADIRAHIFDPFFTTKPMGVGTGLGLDIVRRLILHNDGEINVESEPGRTEFRVVLPLAAADSKRGVN